MTAGRIHDYALELAWEGDRTVGTSDYASYRRGFRISVEGKADLLGSADPAFRGEPHLHNPEDLMLAAVAACHMLAYLALCARSGITVVRYSDAAQGRLELRPDGGGRFAAITLRPHVGVAPGSDAGAASALHGKAHELCFIANSCSVPIRCEPEVQVDPAVPPPGERAPAARRGNR